MRRPLVAGLVLERDAEADPELLHLSVLDRHVLADDLRDAQVADGLRRGRNRVAGGIRPGLGAGPDDLGDPVDAAGHSDFLLGWAAGKADSFRPRAAGPPRAGPPPVTWLRDERDDEDGDDVRHLDHRVDRGARGVLERVPDGVAVDRRRVGLGALAAVGAVLDELLR